MSEIQSVNVFSVDEERLKYRVIVGAGVVGADDHKGEFEVYIPPPTSFANSHRYNQCLVKIDSFTACPTDRIADATWSDGGSAAAAPALIKTAGIIIRANIGSSQTATSKIDSALALAAGGDNQVAGFRQFIPLQLVNVGTTGNGAGAVGPTPTAEGFSWVGIGSGISATDPILSANPFGQKVKFTLINPIKNVKNWIVSAGAGAGAGGANAAQYTIQLTITMIPNDRSEGTD
tara:strand:- start:2335 stop:3033 length:699 start_codon:yes stop_codon:yes gene_type:complete